MSSTDDLKRVIKLLENQEKRITKIENLLTSRVEKTDSTKHVAKKSNPKSVYGLIEQLKDDSFFDTPKTLKEINSRLRQDGYIYNVTSLTNPLQRLLKQRKLGRISVDGLWAYVKR